MYTPCVEKDFSIERISVTVNGDDEGKIFNFKSEDSFGTEVIKGGNFSFFDAAGDEGAGTACGGEVNSRTALHGLNDVRGTETFSNHAGKTAGVNETGGVGIHASAGGGTCAADGESRRGGTGTDEVDEFTCKIDRQFFAFIEQGTESLVGGIASGPDFPGEENTVSGMERTDSF